MPLYLLCIVLANDQLIAAADGWRRGSYHCPQLPRSL